MAKKSTKVMGPVETLDKNQQANAKLEKQVARAESQLNSALTAINKHVTNTKRLRDKLAENVPSDPKEVDEG